MSKKSAIESLKKITNEEFFKAVSAVEPKFLSVVSKKGQSIFNDAGFEAMQNLPGTSDAITDFYGIAALIGAQFVDFRSGRNVLDDMGILEVFRMSLGAYAQRNRVTRIHNVDPAFKGLKNGDSPDQYEVRKPEIIQDYYGLNMDYQNWFTWQDFDLKLGWTSDNGIGDILSQMFSMVALDRKEYEFSLFFHVLSGAINSTTHPLLDTQKIALDSWTDGAVTDAEINGLIETVKNAIEALTLAPTFDEYNAAEAVNDAGPEDHVLLIRKGIKSKVEKVLGYAFNDERLQFPIRIKVVSDFGGLIPMDANDDEMQVVADKNGVIVGYIDGSVTVNGRAFWDSANNRWLVNVTSGAATADTTFPAKPDHWSDPNEDIIAVIAQRGVIFELRQNEMVSRPSINNRGMYTNQWFNEANNGINYNHTRNLITIRKPDAEADNGGEGEGEGGGE